MHLRTALFAVAHAFTDPDNTVIYRVTIPEAPTDTDWGDGTNGFFYQAIVNGNVTFPSIYVPFNGMAVEDDNRPVLPQFTFVVEVDVTNGEQNTTLEIDLCTTNYMEDSDGLPPCTQRLWTDTYTALPVPAIGNLFGFFPPVVLFDAETGSSVSVVNNGVYPGRLLICPSSPSNQGVCAADGEYDDEALQWFYDHLLFFDLDGRPYTNDIFDDGSAQHRSIGVLTIDEAAYPVSATQYRTRYGSTASFAARELPEKQFFFYTINQSSTAITVGVQYLYDSDTCNGDLNNVGCGPATGLVSISPAAAVSPALMTSGNVEAVPVNQNASAGMVETRTIEFRSGSGTCTAPVNPLAINASAAQPNRPNYVINDSRDASTSTLWNKRFAPALYYVLPTGFGNCDSSQEPFCHLTGGYVAYVPHYTPSTTEVTLNGGSTDQALVDGFILADQYELEGLTGSDRNALIWFDNCGHGDVYEECKGSVSCDYMLGSRKSSLPTPPNDGDTYTYSVTNSGPAAIVFGKECCASWYQKDDNTGFLQPPVQIHDRFGVFVGPNSTFDYQTLFSDESIVAYDAATGNRLYKLRLNAGDKSAVFGCTDAPCRAEPFSNGCPSVDVTGQVAATDGGLPWGVDGEFRTDGGLEIKSTGEAIDLTDPSLEGAAVPEAVFQRQRFDTATVKWEFPVPEGDQIEIRLFVAAFNETPEPSFTFKVEGSNTSVAISPGELFRGVMASYVATIEDGILDLELVP